MSNPNDVPTKQEAIEMLRRAWERFVQTRDTPQHQFAYESLREVWQLVKRIEERESQPRQDT